MTAFEQCFKVVPFVILYKVTRNFSLWMKPRPTVWPFKWKLWNNLLNLVSLTSTLLSYWPWTSTEHDTDRHDLFTIVTAARGCTVSLGCSRRLDHRVIKMDLWPSFSQPNVRENQPFKFIAANSMVICSQTSLSQIVGRMPTEENNLWGKLLT